MCVSFAGVARERGNCATPCRQRIGARVLFDVCHMERRHAFVAEARVSAACGIQHLYAGKDPCPDNGLDVAHGMAGCGAAELASLISQVGLACAAPARICSVRVVRMWRGALQAVFGVRQGFGAVVCLPRCTLPRQCGRCALRFFSPPAPRQHVYAV